jgi:hypothetical protein
MVRFMRLVSASQDLRGRRICLICGAWICERASAWDVGRDRPARCGGDQERDAAEASACCARCLATHSACVGSVAALRPRRAAGDIQMRQRFSINVMCSLSGSGLAGSRPFRPAWGWTFV